MFARRLLLAGFVLSLALTGAAFGRDKAEVKETSSFARYQSVSTETAQKEALAFLTAKKKTDAKTRQAFAAIWKSAKTTLDKLADSFALADPAVAGLVETVRDKSETPSTEVPALLKAKGRPAFVRDNLILFFATGMAKRRSYEEALEAFDLTTADKVADPASFYFHKAVCEQALLLKDKAETSINALLTDVLDAPERYQQVAALMHYDMLAWDDQDLGWIARQMDSIQRRLDLKRGGKHTQKLQREVLVRLEEKIKRLEDKIGDNKGCPEKDDADGPKKPGDGEITPPKDTPDGRIDKLPGEVDAKTAKKIENWGKLPEKERAQVIAELMRKFPGADKAVTEAYFRNLSKTTR